MFRLFFCIILFSFNLGARPGLDEEAYLSGSVNVNIKVNADGTSVQDEDVVYTILANVGVDYVRQLLMRSYDENLSEFKVIAADTTYEGQNYPVKLEDIEDKPVASDPNILTKVRQVLIPFQHLKVGSKVHLKARRTQKITQISKLYNERFLFQGPVLWKDYNLTIQSSLPLQMMVSGQCDKFNIQTPQAGNYHIQLKKPFSFFQVDESADSILEPESIPSIFITTENDYLRGANIQAKKYEEVISQDLPEKLSKIYEEAKLIKGEEEKIEFVISQIIKSFHYLSSRNTIEGRLEPRSLAIIAAVGYAGCKEFSSMLSVILRKLGFKANVAVVQREPVYLPLPDKFQKQNMIGLTNHAIVKAESPSGKVYWLDPTNPISMVRGIHSDIAGRPAFVLRAEGSTYEWIPYADYLTSKTTVNREISFKDGAYVVSGDIQFDNESAVDVTRNRSELPDSIVASGLMKALFTDAEKIEKFDFGSDVSNIVESERISFQYESSQLERSNLGDLFLVTSNWVSSLMSRQQDDVGALYLGNPTTITKRTKFQDVKLPNLETVNGHVESEWVDATRTFIQLSDGVELVENIHIKKPFILTAELRSAEFEELLSAIKKSLSSVYLRFEPLNVATSEVQAESAE